MKLELLCLTMPSRFEYLRKLLASLEPQSATIRIRTCDPKLTLGENRDILRQASSADYIAFVDDDDILAADYMGSIVPLLDGVDYIGFDVQCYIDGTPMEKVTHHALKYGGWYEDETGYYRDISHINPIRRELALAEPMEGGHGEDVRWADRMRKRGVLKTEHVIPRVLYHYFFRTRKNIGKHCPNCKSDSTVLVETGTWCNSCGQLFDAVIERKSCLWG